MGITGKDTITALPSASDSGASERRREAFTPGTAAQVKIEHPLARFGYKRAPHWLWRMSPCAFLFVSALKDIWLIVTGRLSLHRAWQAGHDHGTQMEYRRTVINGGR